MTYPTLGKVIEIIIKSTFGARYPQLQTPLRFHLHPIFFVRGKTDGFCIERDVFRFCLKSASFPGKRMATWRLKKALKTALADENRGVMHKGARANGSLKSYSKSDLKFLKCLPTPPQQKQTARNYTHQTDGFNILPLNLTNFHPTQIHKPPKP